MSKYLDDKRKIYYESLKTNIRESNETSRSISTQLIFFATVIFSLSFIIFQNDQLLQKLVLLDKIILVLIWLFLGLSVYFGISQFFKDYNLFKKISNLDIFMLVLLKDDKTLDAIKSRIVKIDTENSNEEIDNAINEYVIAYEEQKAKIRLNIKKTNTKILFYKIQAWLVYISLALIFIFLVNNLGILAELLNHFEFYLNG